MLAAGPALSQEPPSRPGEPALELAVTPYVWATSLDGTAGAGRVRADVDLSFGDILDDLQGALMVDLVLRKGRLALFADSVYANLNSDGSTTEGRLKVVADIKQYVQDAALSYRVSTWTMAEGGGWALSEDDTAGPYAITIDPYVGVRYSYLSVNLTGELDLPRLGVDGSRTEGGNKHWVAPIVGIRSSINMGERWALSAGADVGGTDRDENFTWQAFGVLGYRFDLFGDDNASFVAGYKALKQKYRDGGNGVGSFEWDVTMQGPVIGLWVRF